MDFSSNDLDWCYKLSPIMLAKLKADVINIILTAEVETTVSVPNENNKNQEAIKEYMQFLKSIGFQGELEDFAKRDMFPKKSTIEHDCLFVNDINKWIPLDKAHLFVRPVSVRMKKLCYEDFLPLSKIKKELNTSAVDNIS